MLAARQNEEAAPRKERSKAAEKARVHISLPPELGDRLVQIQEDSYAGTITEVIKNALVVYAALLDDHKQGRQFFTKSKDGDDVQKLRIFI